MADRELVLVESEGKCLFCQELLELVPGEEEDDDTGQINGEWATLKQIGSYFQACLGIEVVIVKQQELGRRFKWRTSRAEEFSGLLCYPCWGLADKLTVLCKDLELVQMKVDQGVKEMVEIVGKNGKSPEKSKIFEGLHRSRQMTIKLESIRQNTLSNDSSSPSPPPPKEEPKNQVPHNTNHVNCPYCSENLPMSEPKKVTFHTVMQHPDQFFSTAKLDHVSFSEFQALAKKFLMEISEKSTTSHGLLHKCFYCAYAFKYRQSVIVHMVDNHYSQINYKLTSLQAGPPPPPPAKSPSPSPPPPSPPPPDENSSPVVQQFYSLTYQTTLDTSEDTVHPKVLQLSQTIPFSNATVDNQPVILCSLCPSPGTAASIPTKNPGADLLLRQHVCHQHPEYFFPDLRKPEMGAIEFNKLAESVLKSFEHISRATHHVASRYGTRTCALCSNATPTTERRIIFTHLVSAHYEVIKQTIKHKQEETAELIASGGDVRPCKICGATFTSGSALGGHMTAKHRNRSPRFSAALAKGGGVQCPHCFTELTSRYNLRRHLMRSCPALLNDQGSLKTNFGAVKVIIKQEAGSGATENVKKCSLCGVSFSNVFLLGRHMKLKHPHHNSHSQTTAGSQPGNFAKCPYCAGMFVKRNMTRHKTLCHRKLMGGPDPGLKETQRFKCNLCANGFPTLMGLNVHKTKAHGAPVFGKPNSCRFCGMEFSCASNLSRHVSKTCPARRALMGQQARQRGVDEGLVELATSSMTQMATSSTAQMVTSSMAQLAQNIVLVRFPCKFCGKLFGRRNDATRHENIRCLMRFQDQHGEGEESAGQQEGVEGQNDVDFVGGDDGGNYRLEEFQGGEEEAMEIPGGGMSGEGGGGEPIVQPMETSLGGESMMNIDGDNLFQEGEGQMEDPFGEEDVAGFEITMPGMEEDPLQM